MEDNTKVITEIQVTVKNIEREISELKSSLKSDYQTKESVVSLKESFRDCTADLEERVVKIEANLSKIVWIVLTAVITAILYLVIKT